MTDSGPPFSWALPSDVTAPRRARHLVESACGDLCSPQVDTARLLVTELVANAVQHGAAPVVLHVARDDGALRVEVQDAGPDLPSMLEGAQGGRACGLWVVAALASEWGVTEHDNGVPGKRVWFVLDCSDEAQAEPH
ncbi:MAG: ATP-binding protein [Nocardioidaceae bacterium]|nr:ATP-binding protein [Nocardioidaceae bacterium]NUS50980.1 ATP-binding protein [Nocardioidaceae bacterium]